MLPVAAGTVIGVVQEDPFGGNRKYVSGGVLIEML
jgi:hypothetical protein